MTNKFRVGFRARVMDEVKVRLGLEKCIYPYFNTGKCEKLEGVQDWVVEVEL